MSDEMMSRQTNKATLMGTYDAGNVSVRAMLFNPTGQLTNENHIRPDE
jgi:hypothetical protein